MSKRDLAWATILQLGRMKLEERNKDVCDHSLLRLANEVIDARLLECTNIHKDELIAARSIVACPGDYR